MGTKPNEILEEIFSAAIASLEKSVITDDAVRTKVEFICRCNSNKAPIRFLMAGLLAKIDKPEVDIRKPYTEIEGDDTFSGRSYDEGYVESFVIQKKLPCNTTTSFLTPAFRNINRVLTTDLVMVGRPREVYSYTLELLDLVYREQIEPNDLLAEIMRFLLIVKKENESRMEQLIAGLKHSEDILPLSSEQIVTLLNQHLACKNSSRLPTLMVAAAYLAVNDKIDETALPLEAHNAADKQTGSVGDVEITLVNDEDIVTSYEMKDKRVTTNDIEIAIKKIAGMEKKVDNYIFITTDEIEDEVDVYAKNIYEQTGVEIAVLDCLGFIRHYLHFFHRYRNKFLDIYQQMVLDEPTSSVSQPLKEAFLVLRKAAETDN